MDEFYRIPFSSGEARAALAALHVVRTLAEKNAAHDTGELDAGILDNAIARFAGEVPDFAASQAEKVARDFLESVQWDASDADAQSDEPPFPIGRTRRLLEEAFGRRAPVQIEYFVRSRNEWTTRRVDISNVSASGEDGAWLLAGQCDLRGDHRYFRLDHIRAVRVLDEADEDEEVPDPFAE